MEFRHFSLAVITTHPIQYYGPFFKRLAKSPFVRLKVFYTWSQSKAGALFDPGFGKEFAWDVPLLDGYEYEFVENVAKKPGVYHFRGIDNPDLCKVIEAWEPDAVLIIGWNFKSHLRSIRYFKERTPVLFKGDSTLLDKQPFFRSAARKIFLTWLYKHVDYALYAGKHNKEYFRSFGLKEEQLVFVPHSVDNERFADLSGEHQEEANALRKDLNILPGDIVFLFAGKLEPKKDPFFLIRLAKKLNESDTKFMIVGNGELEQQLKAETKGSNQVIFLGFQNQRKMPSIYRLGDVFVLPSQGPGETWGLSINEAMASGRPVVVSNKVGCAPDLVEEDVTGWQFELGEKGETMIADKLHQIISKKEKFKNAGRLAKERVFRYSYELGIQNLVELCKSLQEKGTRLPR